MASTQEITASNQTFSCYCKKQNPDAKKCSCEKAMHCSCRDAAKARFVKLGKELRQEFHNNFLIALWHLATIGTEMIDSMIDASKQFIKKDNSDLERSLDEDYDRACDDEEYGEYNRYGSYFDFERTKYNACKSK
jgi:hypothetical protein